MMAGITKGTENGGGFGKAMQKRREEERKLGKTSGRAGGGGSSTPEQGGHGQGGSYSMGSWTDKHEPLWSWGETNVEPIVNGGREATSPNVSVGEMTQKSATHSKRCRPLGSGNPTGGRERAVKGEIQIANLRNSQKIDRGPP